MAQRSKPLLRLRQPALRLQDRLQRVRALRKPRTHFIEACCPAHSSPVAPFGFVGPRLPPPLAAFLATPYTSMGRLSRSAVY